MSCRQPASKPFWESASARQIHTKEDRGMHAARMSRFQTLSALALGVSLTFGPSTQGAVDLPGHGTVHKVDFERHIMGLFGRLGCNSGSCHGSFQGRNGFRLSLFGYDPEKDFRAITRDLMARPVNPSHPKNTLLLLKPIGAVGPGARRPLRPLSGHSHLCHVFLASVAQL